MPGKEGCFCTHPRPSEQKKNSIRNLQIKYLKKQIDYFVHTCFGGFDAEKVSGIRGTCSTFLSSRCTRLRTSPLEISLFEYRDGSLVP